MKNHLEARQLELQRIEQAKAKHDQIKKVPVLVSITPRTLIFVKKGTEKRKTDEYHKKRKKYLEFEKSYSEPFLSK